MARIVPRADILPSEIEGQRDRKPRKPVKKRFKITFLLVVIFILAGIFLVGLAGLAKTGIVQLPILSSIFYQVPQPSRTIEIKDSDLADFEDGLQVEVGDQTVILEVSEKELTFLLRQLLASDQSPLFAKNIQAVIMPDKIEVFGLLLRPVKANLTILAFPAIGSGRLNLNLLEIKIGNLKIPPFLATWFKDRFLINKINEFNNQLESIGSVQSLQIYDGKIKIYGQLDLTKLK